jgi:serine/threonine-protein kinase RsbW
VLDEVAAASLPRQLVYRLELALEEVLMNIVWHAYGDSGEGEMTVRASRNGDEVTLVFEDSGPPFDPLQAAAPPVPASVDEAKVGGLGLVLLRRVASALRYERRDGRNRLEVLLRP